MIVTPEQLKAETCQKEITAVLTKYGMKLDPFFQCNMSGMQMGVKIVPGVPAGIVVGGKAKADG